MKIARVVLAAALSLAALAGCGLPSSSSVVVQGRGERSVTAADDVGTWEPDGRAASSEPSLFVRNFLAAAAGNADKAQQRMRTFLSPGPVANAWAPAPTVHIIHLDGDPLIRRNNNGFDVELRGVDLVADLGTNGALQTNAPRKATYTFRIAEGERHEDGLFVTAPPPVILLSDEAFKQYYLEQTLYFWSTDNSTLVPDVRYLPYRDVSAVQRPTQIVNWIIEGPAEWLRHAVRTLPPSASLVGNVPLPVDGALEVSLLRAADPDDPGELSRLATQLRWSLLQGSSPPALDLHVDQFEKRYDDSDYQAANPAVRGDLEQQRMVVYQGRVRQLDVPGATRVPELPTSYRDVRRAGYAHLGQDWSAALVRPAGRGIFTVDTAATIGDRPFGPPRPTGLRARLVGRPLWIRGGKIGLVVADGRLLSFHRGEQGVRPVDGTPPTGVTAAAISPDGRRVVYLARGQLFVAALAVDVPVSIGVPQPIPVRFGGLTAVDFTSLSKVVVAGREARGEVHLVDVSLDGVSQEVRPVRTFSDVITAIATTISDPLSQGSTSETLYESNGSAFEPFASTATELRAADLMSSPVPAGVGTALTAPFFVG